MRVVDASVWMSRLVPQDVYHGVSCRWLEVQAAAGDRLVAPVLLLTEVVGPSPGGQARRSWAIEPQRDWCASPTSAWSPWISSWGGKWPA